jgi:hypothetical protein
MLRIGIVILTAVMPNAMAQAFDDSKYPDWKGQWNRLEVPGIGPSFDPTKRPGLGQQAPLTPEYQKILEASLAGSRRWAVRTGLSVHLIRHADADDSLQPSGIHHHCRYDAHRRGGRVHAP